MKSNRHMLFITTHKPHIKSSVCGSIQNKAISISNRIYSSTIKRRGKFKKFKEKHQKEFEVWPSKPPDVDISYSEQISKSHLNRKHIKRNRKGEREWDIK